MKTIIAMAVENLRDSIWRLEAVNPVTEVTYEFTALAFVVVAVKDVVLVQVDEAASYIVGVEPKPEVSETLYDNTAPLLAGLSADLNNRGWANDNSIRMTFTRALEEADDLKWLLSYGSFTANGISRPFKLLEYAGQFRVLPVITPGQSNIANALVTYIRRNNATGFDSGAMALHLGRRRAKVVLRQ